MKKIRMLAILFIISFSLMACQTKEEPKEEKKLIADLAEEKKEGERNLVRDKEIEKEVEKIFNNMLEKKDYKNYSLVDTEIWVYKKNKEKIYEGKIRMDLREENKEEADKIFKASSEYLREELSKKYEYEKLELIWENENYPEDDLKELIFYK